MDVMKEDMKLVSVSEEDAEGEEEMEAADWLWPPLRETAWRRAGEETQQPIHSLSFFFPSSTAETETQANGTNCAP